MPRTKSVPDLVSFVSEADVNVLISRLPDSVKGRLRDVFLSAGSFGVRRLGSVSIRGRRDITLYSILPARVSLGRFLIKGQSAIEFGGPSRGQWPPWAIRRFLLYEVFLHEVGHLQLVNRKSRAWRRKYADETLADRFADEYRRKLWKVSFDHPDIVHNPPQEDEIAFISAWQGLNKKQRFSLVELALGAPYGDRIDLSRFGDAAIHHENFLSRAFQWNSEHADQRL